MYQPGDMIVYGSTGVCRVKDVAKPDFKGAAGDQLYYTLEPLYQDGMIFTPVDSKVFMRPVITEEEAEALIDRIPTIETTPYHSSVLRELEEHYSAYLKTHDCGDLIEMTMSIYAKKKDMERQHRKFGAVDERFLKRGEDLLFGEMAVALNMEKAKVGAYIGTRIGEMQTQQKEA
jgi:CarD family transcriptional regulator